MRLMNEVPKLHAIRIYPLTSLQQLRVKGMIIGIPVCDGACGYADFKIKRSTEHKFLYYIHQADYEKETHWQKRNEQMG